MNSLSLTGKNDQHIHWLTQDCGIHHDMVASWQALSIAAKAQGYDLTIASGFRNFDRQLSIWNRKFSGELKVKNRENTIVNLDGLNDKQRIEAILTYSALPGASRHHWGTDIDVYAPNLLNKDQQLQLEPWEYQLGGPFAELNVWLVDNAKRFGFYFPYDKFRGGIALEPWHMSYFPLADNYQKQLTTERLAAELHQANILGKNAIIAQLDEIFITHINNIGNSDNG